MKGRSWRRLAQAGGVALGVLLGAAGALFSGAYAWSLVEVLGEPDRSVVFWHAIFLFMGMGFTGAGATLLLWLSSDVGPEASLVPQPVVRACLWTVGAAGGLTAAAAVALAAWHVLAGRAG